MRYSQCCDFETACALGLLRGGFARCAKHLASRPDQEVCMMDEREQREGLPLAPIGRLNLIVLPPETVARLRDLLPDSSRESIMDTLGFSKQTWHKVRHGAPVRFMLVERAPVRFMLVERALKRLHAEACRDREGR
jgi:hypothetical protein